MLSLKEAIKIVNEKEPRMDILGCDEYKNAFTFGLAPKGMTGFANSCCFAVWKDGSRAEWVHFSKWIELFGFGCDIIKRFEKEDLEDM